MRRIRSIGTDRHIKAARCTCGKVLDGATAVNADCTPKAGDLTVCIYCRTVLMFTAAGELEPADPAKLPPDVRAVVDELKAQIAKAQSS